METASGLIIATALKFPTAAVTDPLLDQAYNLGIRIHNLRDSRLRRAAQS